MDNQILEYGNLIVDYAKQNYKLCFREPQGLLKYKFIVPGSVYSSCLWDWDSWLVNLALRKIATTEEIGEYEKGCVLNFLEHVDESGRIPIYVDPVNTTFDNYPNSLNIHKPCLASHALFVVEQNGDSAWLKDKFEKIQKFIAWYEKNCKHESGLYVWLDDFAIGVDNDPCTFYRPNGSSASILLNCFMYKELESMAKLAEIFGFSKEKSLYESKANELKSAIQEYMWDERDGSFYSVDVNLLPIDLSQRLHSGCPRHWSTLIQRIDVWACFLPLWAGIATKEQADLMLKRYLDERTFFAPYGVRTLGKMEKMYTIKKSGNPSCWLGPIWGCANYFLFDGLVKYGYDSVAKDLAEKTIKLFGQDIEKNGQMHEYYHPDTGEGVNNPGFQNWNLLSINMFEWLKENNY